MGQQFDRRRATMATLDELSPIRTAAPPSKAASALLSGQSDRQERIRNMLLQLSPSVSQHATDRPQERVDDSRRAYSAAMQTPVHAVQPQRLSDLPSTGPTLSATAGAAAGGGVLRPHPAAPEVTAPQFNSFGTPNSPNIASAAIPSDRAADFRFGGQHVMVTGPPMHQEMRLYPDGSLTTIHTPLLTSLQGGPSATTPSATPVGIAAWIPSPTSPAESDMAVKYKRAKKMLQVVQR